MFLWRDLSIHLTTNLPKNLPVEKNKNRLRFDRVMVMCPWPTLYVRPTVRAHQNSEKGASPTA